MSGPPFQGWHKFTIWRALPKRTRIHEEDVMTIRVAAIEVSHWHALKRAAIATGASARGGIMIGRNPDAGGHALHQGEPIAHAGAALSQAKAAMILLHGRGASADGILSLAEAFADPEIAYFAPQAAGHSWYPHSFLAPLAHNEPWLSSALQVIAGMVRDLERDGIPLSRIVLLGFSQGGCLALEFAARNAGRYGAVIG